MHALWWQDEGWIGPEGSLIKCVLGHLSVVERAKVRDTERDQGPI